MSITASAQDQQLAAVKRQWEATQDPAQRNTLSQQANKLRSGGASEAVANFLVYGSTEGQGADYARQYMGANYDPAADWAKAQAAGQPSLTATSSSSPSYTAPTLSLSPAQKVDTKPLYSAIESYKSTPLQAQTPQTFSGGQLADAIGRQQTAGQAPTPNQAQFATPEQFGAYVNQTAQMLQPYTDQQKKAAEVAYNQAMQKVLNRAATTGAHRTGGYQSQQMGAAGDYARTQAGIQASALANALQTALQTGQLSLNESGQIFNQGMAGAQFDQGKATTNAQLLANALSSQEGIRQGEMGLNLNQQTNALAQLANVLGLDVGQNQWAQGYDLQRELAQHGLNMDAARLNQGAYQFDKTFPLQEAGVTGTYQGKPTVAAEEASWSKAMDELKANMQMDEANFDQWLKQQQLAISQAAQRTEAQYKAHIKSQGLKESDAKTVTNARIADLMNTSEIPSVDKAYQYLAMFGEEMANEGVDMKALLDALKSRFPEHFKSNNIFMLADPSQPK